MPVEVRSGSGRRSASQQLERGRHDGRRIVGSGDRLGAGDLRHRHVAGRRAAPQARVRRQRRARHAGGLGLRGDRRRRAAARAGHARLQPRVRRALLEQHAAAALHHRRAVGRAGGVAAVLVADPHLDVLRRDAAEPREEPRADAVRHRDADGDRAVLPVDADVRHAAVRAPGVHRRRRGATSTRCCRTTG